MRTQVNTFDGIQTWRACPTCEELLSKHRSYFADDENICSESCVNEVLVKGQTPEELLNELKNETLNIK
jgi:predicted nucleic acid-binding Zn ribbon protein